MKSFALCQLLCIFALPLPPLKANGLSSRSAEEKSLAWYLCWNLTVYAIGPLQLDIFRLRPLNSIATVPRLPDQKATGFQSCEFPYCMFVDQFLANSDQP